MTDVAALSAGTKRYRHGGGWLLPLVACWALSSGLAGCMLQVDDRVAWDASVSISPDFTAREQVAIVRAIDLWAAGTDGRIRFRASIGGDGDVDIVPGEIIGQTVGATVTRGGRAATWPAADWLLSDSAQAVLPIGVTVDDGLTNIAMHELGHALGLWHVDGTLMRPNGWAGARVDPTTLALLTR